jgi:ATP-binding cassette, subfamily B, bacterial
MSFQPQEDTFSERIDWKLWARVFKHALPYRNLLIPLIIAAVVIAGIDASFALVTRWVVDDVMSEGSGISLWPYTITYFGLVVGLAVGVWIFIIKAGGLSNHMSHDIRRDCFKRLQELEFAYFDHRPVGWLISRLTSDCDKLARIIAWGTLDLVWATLLVLAISVILIVLHPILGLLVLSIVPPLIWISAVFQKKLLLSSRETRKYNSMITASLTEGLNGLRTTKTLVRESDNLGEFQHLSTQMFTHSVRNAVQSAIYIPIVLTLGSIAAGIALWRGGLMVLDDRITLGTLVAFIFYAGQFFNPINQIAQILVQLQAAQAAGERVLSLLATEPAILDSPAVRERIRLHQNADRPQGIAEDGFEDYIDAIEFRDVDFSYVAGEPILSNFNLTVQKGQMIALVGASGGGKSTIVNLAARFYEPTGGAILVNGRDYRERSLHWYQANMGIVLQSPHLFGGSVRDNIRYGRLDASDAEIEQAARLVNAHDFIVDLDAGYDTDVGEGGNRLSTGQKQLVSFARAILAQPQVFIMDEATSSIDTETEQLIQEGLKTLFRGRISFVIAHRLSTIRSADRILVIDKGRIVEGGTHDELMVSGGHYHTLYTRQFQQESTTRIVDAGSLSNG